MFHPELCQLAYLCHINNVIIGNTLHQGLFCHDQVSSGQILDFFNLGRNLRMFLDTLKPRTENKNLSLEKKLYG